MKTEQVPDLAPSPLLAPAEDISYAVGVLDHFKPQWRERQPTEAPPRQQMLGLGGIALLGQTAPLPEISDEDWAFARQEIRKAQSERSPAIQRRAEVVEWFARMIHDRGSIRLFAVPIGGGPVSSAAPAFWNAKLSELDHILRNCCANWHNPLDSKAPPEVYLFLHQEDFINALVGPENPAASASENAALAVSSERKSAAPVFEEEQRDPQPREDNQRFKSRDGKHLTELRDLTAQILIAEFGATGGKGRAASLRINAVSSWFTGNRKTKTHNVNEPSDIRRLIKHLDETFFGDN